MKKVLKIFGYFIATILLLLILLPVIFKGKIVELVKEETNAMLNAKVDFGDFSMGLISTFPNFNFEIENVSVEGVDKFQGVKLAEIKTLALKVDLMSVISGDEIDIKSIHINEPSIRAIVLADTTANWDIMKESNEVAVEEEASTESSFKLGLKDLTINNGYVLYKDETSDLVTEIKGLNFNLNGDMTAESTTLNANSTIDEFNLSMEGMNYMKKSVVAIDAAIEADLANSKYTFSENEFRINELVLGMDGWVAMPNENIDLDLSFGAKQTEFKNILSMVPAVYLTDFSSIKTAGKLALSGNAKGTYSETSLPAFGINLLVHDAMFKYPDLPKSVNNILVDLKVTNPDGDLDHTVVDLKAFHIEIAGNPIDANLYVSTPISDANVKAGLKAKFNLKTLQDVMPMDSDQLNGDINSNLNVAGRMSALEREKYEEFKAEGSFSINNMNYTSDSLAYDVLLNSMTLDFSPEHVQLSTFDAKIGKSDIQANGRIDNIFSYVFSEDQELMGTFNVTSTLLDLNEFATEETESSEAVVKAEESTNEEPLAVIEVPRNINFKLSSSFQKVLYDKINIDEMKGALLVKDQRITMDNLGMKIFDGTMVMDGFYETTNPKKPGINFDMDITDFNVQSVVNSVDAVAEMAPIAKNTHGTFGTKMQIQGTMNEAMEVDLNTLNGNGTMTTNQIQVKDFKPMVKLANVLKNDKLKTIDLGNVDVRYEIRDGRVYTKPFDVKMGTTTGKMYGSSGIDQSLDYTADLKIPSKDMGVSDAMNQMSSQANQLGLDLKASETIDVEAKIGGTFTEPKISTNLKGMAKGAVEEVKEQVKEVIEDKIDEGKEKALEEAKKTAEKIRKEGKDAAAKIRQEGKNAADQIRNKAEIEAKKLEEKGGNFLEKKANQIAAKKLREEAEKKAQKTEQEANKKADSTEAKANEKADKVVAEAESKLN